MKTALFAYRGTSITPGGLLPDKQDLYKKLQDRDIQPLVSLGAESAFTREGVNAHELLNESDVRAAGSIALDEVGVIINRLDRSVKLENMPETWRANMPPVENNNALRSLAFRKHRVQSEVFEPLELGIRTGFAENLFDIDAFIHDNPAQEYFIKPTSGTFSKGLARVKASEIGQYFVDNEGFGKLIIQPAYDFTLALPETIRPYDELAKEDFDAIAKSDITKELRIYGMYSPEATITFPVLRGLKDGVDHWAALDPDSLPEHITGDAAEVINRVAHLTGSQAIYSALDVGYGQLDSGEPQFQHIEFNGRMPYLFGKDKHAGVANVLRDHFADQIAASAHAKNGTI